MNLHFFLGGADLEMCEIARLLQAEAASFFDNTVPWGTRLSAYADALARLPQDAVPVAVELPDDMPPGWPMRQRLIEVDHHGPRMGEACSLRQVFDLLQLPESRWTRRYALVAANDVGHVPAMRALGATLAEMVQVRAEDRAAQGISSTEELAGLAGLAKARVVGNTTVVEIPHGRMATVADPLALSPEFQHLPRALFVQAPQELGYFGHPQVVQALNSALPGGWIGGNPAQTAFWGCFGARAAEPHNLLQCLQILETCASISKDPERLCSSGENI